MFELHGEQLSAIDVVPIVTCVIVVLFTVDCPEEPVPDPKFISLAVKRRL